CRFSVVSGIRRVGGRCISKGVFFDLASRESYLDDIKNSEAQSSSSDNWELRTDNCPLPHRTVNVCSTVPFRPLAFSDHWPGVSCQKKRPSGSGGIGVPPTNQRISLPIVACNSIICCLAGRTESI